jgi:hypothetical protein
VIHTAPTPAAFGRLSDRRRRVAAVVLVAAVLAAAFGWAEWRHGAGTALPAGQAGPTSVSGAVFIEGGPVTVSGQVAGARPQPSARLVVNGATTAGARIVRHLTADARGRFALRLPAGLYTVTALIVHNAPLDQQPSQQITVRAGHPVHVRITFSAE